MDGSESALHATQWAANEAIRRGVPLRVVHAFELPFRYPSGVVQEDSIRTAMREQADHVLAKAVEVATAAAPGAPVEHAVVDGTPVEVLVQESTNATTLVLGTRGLGGFRGLLVGSNAVALAGRAHCPLIVIRGTDAPLLGRPVVVGVDGTDTSEAALGFAFQAAAGRGVGLTTVHCWTDPIVASAMAAGAVIVVDPQFEQEATTVLAEQLASWQQKYPDVPVTQHVVRDSPSRALLHFADTAQLVVVGSRAAAVSPDWCSARPASTCSTTPPAPSRSYATTPTSSRYESWGAEASAGVGAGTRCQGSSAWASEWTVCHGIPGATIAPRRVSAVRRPRSRSGRRNRSR